MGVAWVRLIAQRQNTKAGSSNGIQRLEYYNERSLFYKADLGGFLGLRRAPASAVLALRLQLSEVFRTAFGDLAPTLPSKSDGGGILFFRQG